MATIKPNTQEDLKTMLKEKIEQMVRQGNIQIDGILLTNDLRDLPSHDGYGPPLILPSGKHCLQIEFTDLTEQEEYYRKLSNPYS